MQDKRRYLDEGKTAAETSIPRPASLLEEYKRTPEFDADSIPQGLRHDHRTKAGIWGRIVLLDGSLRYCLDDGSGRSWHLAPEREAWIPPDVPHHVEAVGPVRFYISFWR
ncbi:MAG: DUF1971 domain-containing protein [Sulfuriferula sp.]